MTLDNAMTLADLMQPFAIQLLPIRVLREGWNCAGTA